MEKGVLRREMRIVQAHRLAPVAVIEILSCDGSFWLVTDLNYIKFLSQQKNVNAF